MTRHTAGALRTAAGVLGLGEKASLNEIADRYAVLLRRWNPDTGGADPATCHEMIIRIVTAYRILYDYCMDYEFSFAEDEGREKKSAEGIRQ